MIKATTQHGTYYLIDEENGKAKRVKGDGRNDMWGDGEWFEFDEVGGFDWLSFKHFKNIEVGMSIFFYLHNAPTNYRVTTDVVSIENID